MQFASFLHPACMKRAFFSMLFVVTVQLMLAQKAQPAQDILYGFQQHISPGIKKAGDIDENGNFTKQKSTPLSHYTIYLAAASKTRIYPIQLWINGEAFSVEMEVLAHPPAAPSNINAPGHRVQRLFPETAGTIYRLNPIPLIADKSNRKAKDLALANAAVLYYIKEGKTQYGVLKKFTELEPVSLQ